MAIITIDDLSSALDVQSERQTTKVEANEFHVKVGQQAIPHYVGSIPGVFGQLLPEADLAVAQFYFEAGEGAIGDELHCYLHYADGLPGYLRVTITDPATPTNSEAIVLTKGDRTRQNIRGAIEDVQDYHGQRASFFTIGQFPAKTGATYQVRVASSDDNNTYTAYNVLPAPVIIPLDEQTKALQSAVDAAVAWTAARYTIPDTAPADAVSGCLKLPSFCLLPAGQLEVSRRKKS